MPGRVILVPKHTRETRARRYAYYKNSEDLKRTIDIWREIYKEKFEDFFIHAIPNLKKP